MSVFSSRISSRIAAACAALLSTFLFVTPAFARFVPFSHKAFDLDAILNDPLGLAIGGALLIAFVTGAIIVLRRAPLTADIARKREEFLHALPANALGYKAILYQDEVQGLEGGAGMLLNHRIRVELLHENPAKTKLLYVKDERPSMHRAMYTKPSAEAAKLWATQAKRKNLPAVYVTRRGIYKLEPRHFAEMDRDPDRFLKKLSSRMWANSQLPAK